MTTNTQMLINSLDRAMLEQLKVYRNGSIGKEQNFIVINHENVDAYEISVDNGTITGCTCGHAHFRKQICKHQLKVSIMHGLEIEQLNSFKG